MDMIQRNKDVVLGSEDLEDIYSFKNFPIYMGCTDEDESNDVFSDMTWKISRGSGMIQLSSLIPLDILYKKGHGSGTVGKIWERHHKKFSEFINKYDVKNVLEIGGLHGELSRDYFNLNSKTKWTIIDPIATATSTNRLNIIKSFFDENFKTEEVYDCLVHSHTLEHIYDLDKFMLNISSFMKKDSLLIFSVPNMMEMLRNNSTNTLCFEHTFFITEPYIEFFLKKYGFTILDKNYYLSNHSIFYSAKKTENKLNPVLPEKLYDTNKIEFDRFINSISSDIKILNNIMENSKFPVFLFGSHIFSQILINLGLDTKKIVSLIDNDVNKENKRLYGTNLISYSPKILKKYPDALVILRLGAYNEEIKNDILTNINKNVIFI